MSETNPIYSNNRVLSAIEHVGHGLHVVFHDGSTIEQKVSESIQATEQAMADTPTIVADVSAVITAAAGGSVVLAAVQAALAGFGANVAADVAAAAAIAAEAPHVNGYISTLEAAIGKLLQTLGVDEKQIAAIFQQAASTPTVPAITAAH